MELKYRPDVRIVANNSDITALIRQRLIRLSLTDEAGLQSDTLELVLADHDPLQPILLPASGAELEVWLGYTGSMSRMGLFVVDEMELSGPPGCLLIRAKAAIQTATPTGKHSLYSQKTRSWPLDTGLSSLVEKIAGEHGLRAAIAADIDEIPIPHIDQVNESDINLLTRLGRDTGLVIKPADGALVVCRRGRGISVTGQSLPILEVQQQDVKSWRVSLSQREQVGSVVALYRDVEAADDCEVVVGEGEPVRRLRYHYPDRCSAEQAARAEHEKSSFLKGTLSLVLAGNGALVAEGRLKVRGFCDRLDGEWLITRVTHTLDGNGYVSGLEASRSVAES
ncbi:phage late control D family protein [Haematospirillum sp. 15-248]|uniref:phage late control D family protein n=1 Tax=Haematospirillum sp. 15-248 TaxID=2723107 RepID=UPI001ADEB09C|nr:contractile injection system protein, VgrG/Pvc8 family [Haematospirillum sp. 15-248]